MGLPFARRSAPLRGSASAVAPPVRWQRAGWALAGLACLACCCCCCCGARGVMRLQRQRKLSATYTAVETDPFLNDDDEAGLHESEGMRTP